MKGRTNRKIPYLKIELEGFTVEELKQIMQRIREVEGKDPDKIVFILMEDPSMTKQRAKEVIREIWPT